MGKSKKHAVEVVVPIPAISEKKGKRASAEDVTVKVSKKQKVAEKDVMPAKKKKKPVEAPSESSSESEDEKPVIIKQKVQAKKASNKSLPATKIVSKVAAKESSTSEEEDSSDSDENMDMRPLPVKVSPASNGKKISKTESSSEESSSDSEDEEPVQKVVVKVPLAKVSALKNGKAAASSSSDDDSDSDESSDDDKPAQPSVTPSTKSVAVEPPAAAQQESSSEYESSDDSDEEPVKAPAKPGLVKGASFINGKKESKVESTSEEETSEEDSSDSDEEVVTKTAAPAARTVPAKVVVRPKSSSEDSSDTDDSSDDEEVRKPAVVSTSKPGTAAVYSDDESDSSSDDSEPEPPAKAKKLIPKKVESSEDEESSEEESEDEEVRKPSDPVIHGRPLTKLTKPAESSSSEEDSSDESDEEPQKKKAKVEPAKSVDGGNENEQDEGAKQTATRKEQNFNEPSSYGKPGSKTVFVKNLAWSITEASVIEFFKDVGEVFQVRFAQTAEGEFRGFGHVEFTSEEAARKACKKSGQNLAGRDVYIDLAKERGENNDFKSPRGGGASSGGRGERPSSDTTAFVRGFDKYQDEETIRNSLTEFFSECGIARIRIPTDRESGVIKGFGYVDFLDKESLLKAIEYSGSDLNGRSLIVEEASGGPSGGSGGRGRGGYGGDFGGRRGRGRVDFGGRGGRGRGGRGYGAFKENASLSGSGKKTTFDD